MGYTIRLGEAADVDAAVAIYDRSSLAYHGGVWPARSMRVDQVRNHLLNPATWFLVAQDGPALVGMASAQLLRDAGGAGPVIPGGCFLSYLYVAPERWAEGIGGALLDAVLTEAKRKGLVRTHLLTYTDNERAHRLYRSRGFAPTGRVADSQGEWVLEQ
jgi:ribosomal protein S18 acetylase RimI-like enzyme